MLSYAALSSPAIWGKQKHTLFTTADSNRLRRQRHFKKTCGTWDLHHNVSLCLSVCLCVCLNWKGKTVIRKAGNWAGFVWRLYPATLIILGPKASTCFRRVFIVFPVPTMPCEGGGGRCRNWTEKVITWQWGKKKEQKLNSSFSGLEVIQKLSAVSVTLYSNYATVYKHSLGITWIHWKEEFKHKHVIFNQKKKKKNVIWPLALRCRQTLRRTKATTVRSIMSVCRWSARTTNMWNVWLSSHIFHLSLNMNQNRLTALA